MEDAFPQHPDAEILLSFPGLGIQLAARVLAELGDDRARFADARGLKAYAGSSPITRASGKKSAITRRWVKNDLAGRSFSAQYGRQQVHPQRCQIGQIEGVANITTVPPGREQARAAEDSEVAGNLRG